MIFQNFNKLFLFCFLILPDFSVSQVFTKKFLPGDSIANNGGRYITWDCSFDSTNNNLTKERISILDSLSSFLIKTDSVIIEINVYTELFGSDKYNEKIAQIREHIIIEYLIKRGINPSRLRPRGHHHPRFRAKIVILPSQKKERVEFLVISTDFKR